jgi:hypothetical protein
MHANLSLLHTSNANAIGQALEEPGVPQPPPPHNTSVPEEEYPGPEIQTMYEYLRDAQVLKQHMSQCELHDVAYVPRTIWDRLCAAANLYQFAPHIDGTVRCTYEPLIEQAQTVVHQERTCVERERVTLCFMYLTLLVGILITYICTTWLPGLWTLCVVGLVIFGFIVNAGEYFVYFLIPDNTRLHDAMHARITTHKTKGTLPEALWPLRREPLGIGGARIPVTFPTPPDDVQHMMDAVQQHGHTINLAVTKEAIGLPTNLAFNILEYQYLWHNGDDEGFLTGTECPLVYLTHNSAVAVFAQYGDFPIEAALISEVVRTEYQHAHAQ